MQQENKKQTGLTLGLFFIIITLAILQLLIFGFSWAGLSVEDRSSDESTTKQNNLYFATIASCFTSAILALIIGFTVKKNDGSNVVIHPNYKVFNNINDDIKEINNRMPPANSKSPLNFANSHTTRL